MVFNHLRCCVTGEHPLFNIPRHIALDSIKSISQVVGKLSFPIMCKRRSACSSTEAHQMTIIPSPRHLTTNLMEHYQDSEQVIIQEFIQHDGIIVKVYVADGEIHVSTRPSFINITEDADIVHFDSQALPKQFNTSSSAVTQKPSSTLDSFRQWLLTTDDLQTQKQAHIDHDRLQRIADLLQKQLGLTFFGFDVLLESGTNDYYVVDVNYFPSFKNVPHFQPMFINILKKVLRSI
ncbi:inositol-tetrakisphosphate 1-kinase [Halteromyces radiatus]|uniref:inositol-tetrakisphosphate 1-kinase n=1 Tax=Halteromyces radiatus TaxID=101107 RepID=UPI00222058B6|nr:inositol-tetrakisphosphate 1-kinase [Halteromyces radiatus]KAI8098690.1 inositol-tetrakisphosphate 1-kinase [Halteromyces radiatus]